MSERKARLNKSVIDMVYPVGAIYMSVNSTNPGNLFGGKWEQIKDKFLLSAGDSYAAGSTGGEAQHTLTVDEMPTHSHEVWAFAENTGSGDAWSFSMQKGKGVWYDVDAEGSHIKSQGGSRPHNNMPPYLTVYMWRRIA